MASSSLTMRRLASLRPLSRPQRPCSATFLSRFYSTAEDAPPPLLQKLKGDLKTAMRAKDAPRLTVLRAIMTATLNASKTSSPINTDVQLVGLIRKLQKSSQDAIADAVAAGRDDLADKERHEIQLLEEYIAGSGIQTLGETELRAIALEALRASKSAGITGKAPMGDVMKRVSTSLEGKDVDRKLVANVVREVMNQQ